MKLGAEKGQKIWTEDSWLRWKKQENGVDMVPCSSGKDGSDFRMIAVNS